MKFKNFVKQILFVLVFVIVAVSFYSFSFGENGLYKQNNLKRQIAILGQEADSLKKVLEYRKDEGERLLTDSFYMESIARTKFGMSKKNETVYQFLD